MNIQKNIEESTSHVYFLIREGLYNTLQSFCSAEFLKYNDPFFKFWLSFGLFKEGNLSEAINELNQISSKREIQFSVLSFLDYLHSQSQLIDED
jgi:tetratricopeptide repeat protein 21B